MTAQFRNARNHAAKLAGSTDEWSGLYRSNQDFKRHDERRRAQENRAFSDIFYEYKIGLLGVRCGFSRGGWRSKSSASMKAHWRKSRPSCRTAATSHCYPAACSDWCAPSSDAKPTYRGLLVAHVVASQTLLAVATTGRMNQTQKFIIDTCHQPRYGLIGSCENYGVLENMVEVYVPPPTAVQDRDRSATVSGGPKLLARKTLRDIHWQAS
jgi:hypothetical protein